MLTATMPTTSEDADRPATRRDLAKEHELIEAKSRAEFAKVRQEMAEEFAKVRKEISEEFAKVRHEMAEGFAKVAEEFVKVRKEMAEGFAALRGEMATKAELKAEIRGVRRELRILLALSLAMWGTLANLIVRSG